MSSLREESVWRVPLKLCGIVEHHRGELRGAVGDEYDPNSVLNFDELREEYAELFGWDEGCFRPALCPGGYLDYVLFSRTGYELHGTSHEYDSKAVFTEILPDIELDDVHRCSYEWYDGTDAPEAY